MKPPSHRSEVHILWRATRGRIPALVNSRQRLNAELWFLQKNPVHLGDGTDLQCGSRPHVAPASGPALQRGDVSKRIRDGRSWIPERPLGDLLKWPQQVGRFSYQFFHFPFRPLLWQPVLSVLFCTIITIITWTKSCKEPTESACKCSKLKGFSCRFLVSPHQQGP